MKYSECTPAYAVSVILEIMDGNPPREALDMIRSFMDGEAEVEDLLWPSLPSSLRKEAII
jgi:hypothetical protein